MNAKAIVSIEWRLVRAAPVAVAFHPVQPAIQRGAIDNPAIAADDDRSAF